MSPAVAMPDGLATVLDAGTTERLGWTLLHFVWEGTAVAALLALALLALRRRPAHQRHAASLAALLAMAALPAATYFLLPQPRRPGPAAPVPVAVRQAAPALPSVLPAARGALAPPPVRPAPAAASPTSAAPSTSPHRASAGCGATSTGRVVT